MSQNQILIKRASTAGTVPAVSDLSIGELCLNTNDGILYAKKSVSGVESVISFLDASKVVLTSGTAARATSIANGAGGNVLYQSAAGTTAFVANGTSGQFLQSSGSGAPVWANVPNPDLTPYYLKAGGAISGAVTISSTLGVTGATSLSTLAVSSTSSFTGAVTMSSTLNVTGAIVSSGDITAFSDARLKNDVKTIEGALGKISKLEGVTYTWIEKDFLGNKSGTNDYGVIAQEVKKVFPEMVQPFDIGLECYETVAYHKLVPVLIEAIKELASEVAELKAAAKKASKTKE